MQCSCVIVGGAGELQNSSYASAAAVSDRTLPYCDQDLTSQVQSFIFSIRLALLLKWRITGLKILKLKEDNEKFCQQGINTFVEQEQWMDFINK